MKAIVLWEPWATLMALGLKRVETRSWPTSHRGPLAICAAKREPDWRWIEANDAVLKGLGEDLLGSRNWLHPGCVLAVVEMFGVFCTGQSEILLEERLGIVGVGPVERMFGNYGFGRYGWRTRDPRRLPEPVPCRGRQGLFELPPEAEAAVLAQLKKM